jgi:PRC-barrel domain
LPPAALPPCRLELSLTPAVVEQRNNQEEFDMLHGKRVHLLGVAVLLAGIPLGAAWAQTDSPTSPSPPSATPPSATPTPTSPTPQRPAQKTPDNPKSFVGLTVFSSDGNKMGTVQSVSATPDGTVKAIHIKTGGFLGFGGKLVAIPEGRFTKAGENIQLGISADEVGKLPEVKEQS